ncbi:pyridoxal phosphate-dependent aminotransferase [Lichenihabitans sp. Uapishka_5]|uniref:pyridoxal phosphate-dependent aminotransferase n=1 Tax=Lichenihabitans sp. Uapishka_5 TaxID=3037302 RepID=UPI0029E8189B|nr:pyridoxal phosphate-dependent aminotransferase [Lichenihabitans sp. Uapishka_5]MDX7950208.1 pyridoxal phosphate-dependent aminotransferase [Lichenihabitans sp. Uapishka_5]
MQVEGGRNTAERSRWLDRVQPSALAVPDSGIVEIFNYGRNREGVIPLWVGESDQPTPSFISAAAIRSLEAGETFYTYQRGIPALREAIARDMTALYGPREAFSPERFFVTIGGMHALQIAMRIVGGPGDEFLVPTPAWPNFGGAIMALGARVVETPMRLGSGVHPRWSLDMAALEAAVNPATRAIVINSPSNPLGWTATLEELEAVLRFARRHGLWIIADEIYGRFTFDAVRAPSFHDIMAADDLILFPQTFSKNWAMTGWRIGWLEAPEALGQLIENLVQYSTSGVAVPSQRAALAAIEGGADFVAEQVRRARQNRDMLCAAFEATGRMRFAAPDGGFYLFCGIEGYPDARRLAFRLVDEAGIGAAPGDAFGAAGAGSLRLCFARSPAQIAEVADRLTTWVARNA